MQVPVQISFRDMPVSDAVEAHCWAEAEKLERIDDRISACRIVVVETRPTAFEIHIELSLFNGPIVIDRAPPDNGHDDIRTAVHEAFDQARRRLLATST